MAKGKQPCISYSYYYSIKNTATQVATDAFDKTACHLTNEEFIEAFLEPDHVKELSHVYDLIGGQTAENQHVLVPNMVAFMHFRKQPKIMVPKYIAHSLNRNSDAGRKVVKWAERRRELGIMVADAVEIMDWLNVEAGNAKAFSLVFGALLPIMLAYNPHEPDNFLHTKARSIANTSAIGKIPRFTPEVTERVRECSAMMQAFMMTSDAPNVIPADTCVTLTGYNGSSALNNHMAIYDRPHPIEQNKRVRSFV